MLPERLTPGLPSSAVAVPVAVAGGAPSSRNPLQAGTEVIVSLARAPLGTRVFLESVSPAGPSERIRALALPGRIPGAPSDFRAIVPLSPGGQQPLYAPVALFDGQETRGEAFRVSDLSTARAQPILTPSEQALEYPLPPPVMELVAHADARLPTATVFGPTPEGVRIAFYISGGRWVGPRIHARYKSEGGDWLLVREDGVGIPNVRATLETDDGALLYYQLTGTVDLGPDGYARCLANDLPDLAAVSVVGQVSTSSERFRWLNRVTLVGAGWVNLKIGRVRYDLYSIACDPAAVRAMNVERAARI